MPPQGAPIIAQETATPSTAVKFEPKTLPRSEGLGKADCIADGMGKTPVGCRRTAKVEVPLFTSGTATDVSPTAKARPAR